MNSRHLTLALLAIGLLAACGEKPEDIIIPVVYPENPDPTPGGENVLPPYKVECKKTVTTSSWTTYEACTVNLIYVSTTTACSLENTPSKSVLAITNNEDLAKNTIRISISHLTTKDDINTFIKTFKKITR